LENSCNIKSKAIVVDDIFKKIRGQQRWKAMAITTERSLVF
jgi:hypothetical protein